MSRLDLLLVNPNGRKQVYQSLSTDLAAIEPPTWAILVASFVRKNGYSVKILDAEAESLTPDQVAQQVSRDNPLLVALIVHGQQPSASTQNMPAARATCAAIKKTAPEIPILMGGTHPSSLPERTLREEPVEYVCNGEGPYTILPLLEGLRSGKSFSLDKIGGLWWREGDAVRHNPPSPLVQDLDVEFGPLAWDLLPMDKYRAHNWHCFDRIHERQPYASLYTSFSCPFQCTFCCIASPYGGPGQGYRRFNPEWVIKEIDVLVNRYKVRNIKIIDEMFVLNEKHVIGICDLIIQRGYDLNIWAYARVDTIRDSMLQKLRKAGFTWLGIGIESASKYVRDGVSKSFGKHDIQAVIQRTRDADINIGANFIFGLPDDTLESMNETLQMAIDLCPDWGNFYAAMAYPGSKLYAMAIEKGWPLPESWLGYSQHAYETLPLPTDRLTASEVLKFRDEAFQRFFTHQRYLSYIEERFGPQTLQHVKQMVKIPLPRKHVSPSN